MSNAVVTASFRDNQVSERLTTPLNEAHLVLLISAGAKKAYVHEQQHLEATFDLLNACKPQKVSVVIAGKLQRYSFWNANAYNQWSKYSVEELKDVLKRDTDVLEKEGVTRELAWLNDNEHIIKSKLPHTKISFVSWQAILDSERYQENANIINQWFKTDAGYQKISTNSVDDYLLHHQKVLKNEAHREIAREMCAQYLLEECPLILPSTLSSDYTIYHSEPNALMQETHRRLLPGVSLPWFSIHYQFKPTGTTISNHQLIGMSSSFHSKRQEKRQAAKGPYLVAEVA